MASFRYSYNKPPLLFGGRHPIEAKPLRLGKAGAKEAAAHFGAWCWDTSYIFQASRRIELLPNHRDIGRTASIHLALSARLHASSRRSGFQLRAATALGFPRHLLFRIRRAGLCGRANADREIVCRCTVSDSGCSFRTTAWLRLRLDDGAGRPCPVHPAYGAGYPVVDSSASVAWMVRERQWTGR